MLKYDEQSNNSPDGDELRDIVWWDEQPITSGVLFELEVNARLYVQLDEKSNSFCFCFVEFCSAQVSPQWSGKEDVWLCDAVTVERVCFGTAYFDGIRHLYVPYAHYPDIPVFVKLFQKLHDLELQYCSGL